MCGICGIYHLDQNQDVSEDVLIKMRDLMTHRGPDDAGIYLNGNIGLGHRRLSIIDLSGSPQPMCNEDGTIWLVYNGEIYNFVEIREELLKKGHQFRTKGDSEVLVHLYEECGIEGLQKLNGMFAFCIWDQRKRILYAARDRIGIKPFYYYWNGQSFIFASELKAIFEHPIVNIEIDPSCLREFFAFGDLFRKETLLKNIYKLEAGYHLVIKNDKLKTRKYWDIDTLKDDNFLSEKEAIERLDELLYEAIQRRMISDVPLGVFLSGGVDSSMIAAYMAKIAKEPILTYSVGYPEEGGNEFKYSELIAKYLKSNHTKLILDSKHYFSLLEKMIWHFDMPLKNIASISLYSIAQRTKGKATVVLMGQGSDELFAGYPRIWSAKRQFHLNSIYQTIFPNYMGQKLADLGPKLTNHKIGTKLIARLAHNPEEVACGYSQNLVDTILDNCFSSDIYRIPDQD